MSAHIKALTKVIEKQAEYAEQLMRRFYTMERSITILQFKLAKLEGMNQDE